MSGHLDTESLITINSSLYDSIDKYLIFTSRKSRQSRIPGSTRFRLVLNSFYLPDLLITVTEVL